MFDQRLLDSGGVHAIALRRQLTWAADFADAGDLASALDALCDATALAQEMGHRLEGAGLTWITKAA